MVLNKVSRGLQKASSAVTSYRAQSPGVEGVGFRTHQFRCDNTDDSSLSSIAADFMLASRIGRDDIEFDLSVSDYFSDPMIVTYGQFDSDLSAVEMIDLPKSTRLRISLEKVIQGRRSIREYTGEPVEFRDLAAILRSVGGVTGSLDVPRSDGDLEHYTLRSVPSGGGLYPVTVYVVAQRVRGLSKGVYKYHPLKDKLSAFMNADGCEVIRSTLAGEAAKAQFDGAGVLLVFSITPWRSMRKYGPRGLRFALQEVGAYAQQANLVCTALGLGSCESSSFYEDELNRALDLDGIFETSTHTMTIGVQK